MRPTFLNAQRLSVVGHSDLGTAVGLLQPGGSSTELNRDDDKGGLRTPAREVWTDKRRGEANLGTCPTYQSGKDRSGWIFTQAIVLVAIVRDSRVVS